MRRNVQVNLSRLTGIIAAVDIAGGVPLRLECFASGASNCSIVGNDLAYVLFRQAVEKARIDSVR